MIYKADYSGDVTQLRTVQVHIEVNYQDEYTPIIGTGAKVNIINEGTFDSLNDLLTSTERQFKCVIIYDGTTVFQGYSICDLNEQQFIPWSNITLQFTDYIRRLEGNFFSCLADVGGNSSPMEMIQEIATKIGFGFPLLVNSSLFESTMDQGDTDTFLEQVRAENNMFYSDSNFYDNICDAFNKLLKSFGCHLYSAGDKWILERVDDVTREAGWIEFTDLESSGTPAGSLVSSLKQELNKQSGDFKYVNVLQRVEYDSGLQKLILKLQDKFLDTNVFNDFAISNAYYCRIYFLSCRIINLKTWYINSEYYFNI